MQGHQVASDCRFQGLEFGVWGKGFRNSGFPREARKAAGPHGGRPREGERERERENREKRFAREGSETERGRDTVRQKPSEKI